MVKQHLKDVKEGDIIKVDRSNQFYLVLKICAKDHGTEFTGPSIVAKAYFINKCRFVKANLYSHDTTIVYKG